MKEIPYIKRLEFEEFYKEENLRESMLKVLQYVNDKDLIESVITEYEFLTDKTYLRENYSFIIVDESNALIENNTNISS